MKFKYNEHNVCMNPEIIYRSDEDSKYNGYAIEVSERKGFWGFGYNISSIDNNGGSSSPCYPMTEINKYGNGPSLYKTKDNAIQAAVDYIINEIECQYIHKREHPDMKAKIKHFVKWTIKKGWSEGLKELKKDELTLF